MACDEDRESLHTPVNLQILSYAYIQCVRFVETRSYS